MRLFRPVNIVLGLFLLYRKQNEVMRWQNPVNAEEFAWNQDLTALRRMEFHQVRSFWLLSPEMLRKKVSAQRIRRKEEMQMRIAVTYQAGMVFQHFGHTEQFKLYDVENGKIVSSQVVDTNGQGHGALSGFLAQANVDVLICGGIGGAAQTALREDGIQFFGGVSGQADEAVRAYLAGDLGYDPDVHCDHHEQEHSCGEHACQEDKHGCAGNGGNCHE